MSTRAQQWVAAVALLIATVAQSGAGEKPVYGSDDRREWDHGDALMCATGRSVAALIPASHFTRLSGNRWLLSDDKTLAEANWCEDERFSHQPAVAICTTFLIGKSRVATAAHCINAADEPAGPSFNCTDVVFVFDYAIMDDGETRRRYRHDQIYRCKQIVAHHQVAAAGDWTVIELDRPVDRAPLTLARPDHTWNNDQMLELVGHPLGLPLKWVKNGRLLDADQYTVTAAIDSYEGNSGSPVLIRTDRGLEVIGILSNGVRDYTAPDGNCLRTRVCSHGECAGEVVTRVNAFAHLTEQVSIQPQDSVIATASPSWTSACL